jgi:hypothetical protein
MYVLKVSNVYKQLLVIRFVWEVEMDRLFCSMLMVISVKLYLKLNYLEVFVDYQQALMVFRSSHPLIKDLYTE